MDTNAREGSGTASGGFVSANPFEDAATSGPREGEAHAVRPAGSGGLDDYYSPSPVDDLPQAPPAVPANGSLHENRGSASSYADPAPSTSRVVDRSILDQLNADITKRTAAMDAATRQKESEILAAAKRFLQDKVAQREKEVSAAKAERQKAQQENERQIDGYLKTGALWSAVDMMVDLKKPNNYAKGTEAMRSLLLKLSKTSQPPAASQVSAPSTQ